MPETFAPAPASRVSKMRAFADHQASMITDKQPLRGVLFYQDPGFSLTLHVLKQNVVRVFWSEMSGLLLQQLRAKATIRSGFPRES